MASAEELLVNPVYDGTTTHYNIEPFDMKPPPASEFSIGTAYDMYCAGQIIQSIYTAGNSKVMDSDGEPSQTSASGYFEVGNGDVSYDIAPTGRISVCIIHL